MQTVEVALGDADIKEFTIGEVNYINVDYKKKPDWSQAYFFSSYNASMMRFIVSGDICLFCISLAILR